MIGTGGSFYLSLAQYAQLSRIARQGSFILLAIALPQLGVSSAAIGWWEQLLFVGFLLGASWLNAFTQGILVGYPRTQASPVDRPESFLLSVLLVQFAVALLIGLAIWSARGLLIPALTGQATLPYLGYFLIYLVFEWTGQYLEGVYLARQQGGRLLAYALFSYGGLLLCWLLPLLWGASLITSFRALALLGLAKGVWVFAHAFFSFKYGISKKLIRSWLSIVYPLFSYGIIGMLAGGLDPWLVGRYYAGDESTFAIYRYGARELPLIAALTLGLSQALIPKITADLPGGLAELRRECRRLLHLIFPVAILLMATAEWWFPRVFTAAFRESVPLFQVLLLTTIPRMFFNNTILIARGDGRVLNLFAAVELLLNLGLSLALLPQFGLWGLCLATVIALALEKALSSWWLASRHGISIGSYCPLPLWGGYAITLFAVWWLSL